jgi:hypothetical protein
MQTLKQIVHGIAYHLQEQLLSKRPVANNG